MHDETWSHEGGYRGRGRGERRERVEPGRGRGRGRGRGGWERGGPFGPVPFGPGGPRFARGRVRRGDVRAAILDLLAEGQPWNGYQIIQEIAARTDGMWRPSAGSVYPALQLLEDEGLVNAEAGDDRRRMYTLTEAGRSYVTEHADELRASWDAVTGSVDEAEFDLRHGIKALLIAVHQVTEAGSAPQVAQAGKILADARRALYRILASDGEETEQDTQA